MATQDYQLAYWSNDTGKAEVDFVVQYAGKVFPLEVKAGKNLMAKSLRVYNEKYNPPLALRASLADFEQHPHVCDLPLYMLDGIKALVETQKNFRDQEKKS